jgi:hypothetical protein
MRWTLPISCAPAASGHVVAAPSSVMKFSLSEVSRASDRKIVRLSYGRSLLRCGISCNLCRKWVDAVEKGRGMPAAPNNRIIKNPAVKAPQAVHLTLRERLPALLAPAQHGLHLDIPGAVHLSDFDRMNFASVHLTL